MASCFDFAWISANPPMISLASVNGPSVTVILPLDKRTRAPSALGRHPSVDSSHPDFIPSSQLAHFLHFLLVWRRAFGFGGLVYAQEFHVIFLLFLHLFYVFHLSPVEISL